MICLANLETICICIIFKCDFFFLKMLSEFAHSTVNVNYIRSLLKIFSSVAQTGLGYLSSAKQHFLFIYLFFSVLANRALQYRVKKQGVYQI